MDVDTLILKAQIVFIWFVHRVELERLRTFSRIQCAFMYALIELI